MLKILLFYMPLVFFSRESQAEPWLGNRFAQNCAACHAPSRMNRKFKERGCTLSCQGCHVNPNGGGLRNKYGQWTQDRWLRSFAWGKNTEKPQPWYRNQGANREQVEELKQVLQGNKEELTPGKKKLYHSALKGADRTKLLAKLTGGGKEAEPPEWLFAKNNGDIRWLVEATSEEQFVEGMPENDPYKQRKQGGVHAGMEFRYQYWNDRVAKRNEAWPMAFDVGASYRPRESLNNLAGVVEARFFNPPTLSDVERQFTSQAQVRSAYLIYDRLPYNAFVMHGLYRPMFEHFNPDHNTLSQVLVHGQLPSYNYVAKATTVGIAPNVPFINVTHLQPTLGNNFAQDDGFIVNTGLRFVSYGASLVYSYWDTKNRGDNLKKQMQSLQAGWQLWRWTGNAQFLRLSKEFAVGADDTGSVYGLENHIRLWRENYLRFDYTQANTASNLKAGESSEYSVGLRSFLFNMLNFSIYYRETQNSPDATDGSLNREIMAQVHGYFY